MSGMPDDWAGGGRRVRQADGRRTRRTEGRRARPRSEADEPPELSLPELEDDDPRTLAEDAQWAAKLRPGRAPGADSGQFPAATDASQTFPPPGQSPAASWDPSTTGSGSRQAPSGDAWPASPSGGTGEIWSGSPGERSGEDWATRPAATPPPTDPWNRPADTTGDWSSPGLGSGREPGRRLSDLRYERPPGPGPGSTGDDPRTGSWARDPDATASWQPEETGWSPEPVARQPWEPEAPAAQPPGYPFHATPAPEAPASRPWESPRPPEHRSTEPDFGSIFNELARDRQAETPAPPPSAHPDEPMRTDDPAVQAAHQEARRLIEHATGQLFQADSTMLWEQEEQPRTRADEVAEPVSYGTGSGSLPPRGPAGGMDFGSPSAFSPGGPAPGGYGSQPDTSPSGYPLTPGTSAGGYGLTPGTGSGGGTGHTAPSAFGSSSTSGSWGEPLARPPVPDASASYGAASFAPPGSAPADFGPAAAPAAPPAPGRALSPARGRERPGGDHDGTGSGLWAPDRRADEDDTGGVGWLWSVEDHGASPQVPRSWVGEAPKPRRHEVEGLARPIEGRRLRQLEGRGDGRRARHAKRWPVLMAVAAWVVLFAVVCWLYVFPWLEGILPENF